jgi:hypothetical protein
MLSEEGRGDNALDKAKEYLQLVHQAVCFVSNSRRWLRLGHHLGRERAEVSTKRTDEQEEIDG